MKIGYSKIGRAWKIDPMAGKGSAVGGDIDVARALHLISRYRPDLEFVMIGRNSGGNPQEAGYPSNVSNPWMNPAIAKFFASVKMGASESRVEPAANVKKFTEPLFSDLDGHIMWLGQHGTSTHPIPTIERRTIITQPLRADILYSYYLVNGINVWRDKDPENNEEILLCPDPRNYLKARDFKWPTRHPVVAQYNWDKVMRHERYGDLTNPMIWGSRWTEHADQRAQWLSVVWESPIEYRYKALELTAVPNPHTLPASSLATWDMRQNFGMLVNENRKNVMKDRLSIVQQWVTRFWPESEIFGVWTEDSQKELGRTILPVSYPRVAGTLQRWKSTLTTPASGSGWATAKPWECFAYGTICFFHPHYDDQDHILKSAPPELRSWLRIRSPAELHSRVEMIDKDPATYEYLAKMQRDHLINMYDHHNGGVRAILERLPQ